MLTHQLIGGARLGSTSSATAILVVIVVVLVAATMCSGLADPTTSRTEPASVGRVISATVLV